MGLNLGIRAGPQENHRVVLFKPLEATLLVPPLLAFAIPFDCFRMLRAVVRKIVGMSLAPLFLAVVGDRENAENYTCSRDSSRSGSRRLLRDFRETNL